MATRVCVLDGGGPKDSENTLNSFLTKRDEDGFWQIGTDMIGSGIQGMNFPKCLDLSIYHYQHGTRKEDLDQGVNEFWHYKDTFLPTD